ncbi:translation initiation factor IF-2-like [Pteropus medius]|uniref:translation initiation factor IF-2-like n=1 Tax=Pteropus vampyrus TaxID=132908 RepID=UPI00196AE176|nr:translation initiation factor IF-2-like [Pteropus giganteus]
MAEAGGLRRRGRGRRAREAPPPPPPPSPRSLRRGALAGTGRRVSAARRRAGRGRGRGGAGAAEPPPGGRGSRRTRPQGAGSPPSRPEPHAAAAGPSPGWGPPRGRGAPLPAGTPVSAGPAAGLRTDGTGRTSSVPLPGSPSPLHFFQMAEDCAPLPASSQGNQTDTSGWIQEAASFEGKGIVCIKTGGKSDAASCSLLYPLCLELLVLEPQKLFSFLFYHPKVCFVGLVRPAPPSATTITSSTIKVGHHPL